MLRFWETVFDGVVGGDDEFEWADVQHASFGVGFEGVPVGPHEEMPVVELLRAHLFENDHLFTLVSVPPDIVGLDESVWIFCADSSGFSGTCRTVVPFIYEVSVQKCGLLFHNGVKVDGSFDLNEFFD